MTTDNDAASEAELRRRKAFESIYVPGESLFTPDGEVDELAIERLVEAVNARCGIMIASHVLSGEPGQDP